MVQSRSIGSWRSVALSVAAWDGVAAAVDLSCACMFAHELGDGPAGGLEHLDAARGGVLVDLRRTGIFRADPLETLVLDRLPPAFAASAILIVGLGDPASKAWRRCFRRSSPPREARAPPSEAPAAVRQDASRWAGRS